MVPSPVSHPSDVEVRELRAISADVINEAACTGYASLSFHGYRVAAIREDGAVTRRIDVLIEHEGSSDRFRESASAPTSSTHRSGPVFWSVCESE
jgi:hypothetical protein